MRSWPFPRGAGRIIDKFFSAIKFSADTAVIRTTDDFDMMIPLNELIGRHLYLIGEFDRTIVEVLLSLARQGDTLLDIGANIGYVSACFLQNVRESEVICIEPVPPNIILLRKNLSSFCKRSRIIPVALSDRNCDGWMDTWSNNLAASRLVPEKTPRSIAVSIRSTDAILAGINRVELIK